MSFPNANPMRRVVCTGIGLVTPFGLGRNAAWEGLVSARSGVRRVPDLFAEREDFKVEADAWMKCPSRVVAAVPRANDSDPETATDHKVYNPKHYPQFDSKIVSDSCIYAMIAAKEALEDADYWENVGEKDKLRTGVCAGEGMPNPDTVGNVYNTCRQSFKRVSPFVIPRMLSNMTAGHISIRSGFRGPCHSVVTACATGSHTIGDATRFIQSGSADVMVAVGMENGVCLTSLYGFARARALSTMYNDNPTQASRPFDKKRDGFVLSEGAGALILEELEHAKARGAEIYAEVLGYGASGDAHHITSGREDGGGGLQAMRDCLRDYDVNDIWLINCHATSTPVGDVCEMTAVSKLLKGGESLFNGKTYEKATHKPFVNSFKGNLGHMLGAAGAVESAFSLISLKEGLIPKTLNCGNPEEILDDLATVVCDGRVSGGHVMWKDDVDNQKHFEGRRRLILKNSFGFGGTNVSLLFGEYKE